jgi:cytochrome P450
MALSIPESDVDLYADETLADPFSAYRVLRDTAPVVRLGRHDVFVLSRYETVSAALTDWPTFTSAQGVAMNEVINAAGRGASLTTDPPGHDAMRRVLGQPLNAEALRALGDRVAAEARTLVDDLVERRDFDAVTDLAHHLPATIVSHLVGLPEDLRRNMIELSAAAFDASGPMNERTLKALQVFKDLGGVGFADIARAALKPGSWAAQLHEAADRGEIRPDQVAPMMIDYVIPSLDTTIAAIANAVWLFATHPDQWDRVRADPGLIPNAFNEVIRIESPIQGFSRCVVHDHVVEGAALPAGARVLILFGSANRDERKWGDPDRFDVTRRPLNHVGFGYGVHRCVGANLARLEIVTLLTALAKRVERFHLRAPQRQLNSFIRGWRTLPVTVTAR